MVLQEGSSVPLEMLKNKIPPMLRIEPWLLSSIVPSSGVHFTELVTHDTGVRFRSVEGLTLHPSLEGEIVTCLETSRGKHVFHEPHLFYLVLPRMGADL
jgi:hypothetical protein